MAIYSGWVTSSPALGNNLVYIQSLDLNLYAFDVNTGNRMWSYTSGENGGIYESFGSMTGTSTYTTVHSGEPIPNSDWIATTAGLGCGEVAIVRVGYTGFPTKNPNGLGYALWMQSIYCISNALPTKVTRTFATCITGASYYVTFWYVLRSGTASPNAFQLSLDGTTVFQTPPTSNAWIQVNTTAVVASSSLMRLTITMTNGDPTGNVFYAGNTI